MKPVPLASTDRRDTIVKALTEAEHPVSGSALGKLTGVTRQVVVQDIALLRNSGYPIEATARGYVLIKPEEVPTRVFKTRHTQDQTADELNLFVDHGATVVDVFVNHRIYGRVAAELGLKNRRDVARFITELESGISTPLMSLTSGYHFHHITAESEEVLDEIEQALEDKGYLVDYTPFELEHF